MSSCRAALASSRWAGSATLVFATLVAAVPARAVTLAPPAGARFGGAVAVSGDTLAVGTASYVDPGRPFARGAVWVFTRAGASWTLQHKIENPLQVNDSFGISVALAGDVLVVGAPGDGMFTPSATHVFVRSGGAWAHQQRIFGGTGSASRIGASVAISGDTIVSGASPGVVAVFVRSGTQWVGQAELAASDGMPADNFGAAVAISGDTAVVGAPQADTAAGADAGAAYVFVRSGAAWTEQRKLTSPEGVAGDGFGGSVAAEGDMVAVGAPGDDTAAGTDAGSAFVFVRSGAAWELQQQVAASDGAAGDLLGCSVGLAGAVLAVGACGEDGGAGPGEGAAYVFTRSAATWTEQQKLRAAAGAAQDRFGVLALAEGTLVVGAAFDDVGSAVDAGSVHVFAAAGAGWSAPQALTLDEEAALDRFGGAVAASGDTVAVGAPLHAEPGGPATGAVYVYLRDGDGWRLQQRLQPLASAAGDEFGAAVALEGDTLLVGAPRRDGGAGADTGLAYVFTRSGSTWTEQQALAAPDAQAGALFGSAVALSGDDALVGASGHGAGLPAGAVYVFGRSGSAWSWGQTLSAVHPAPWRFGRSVAVSGDVAVVGSQRIPLGPRDPGTGEATVFVRSGGGPWIFQMQLIASPGNRGSFGAAVAVSDGTIVVGAPTDDNPGVVDFGYAYVFDPVGFPARELWAPDTAISDDFGRSLSISGDTIVVGAPRADGSRGTESGAVYVFRRLGTWAFDRRIDAPGGAPGDNLGAAVSVSGATLAAGAPLDHTPGRRTGSAHVFMLAGDPPPAPHPLQAPLSFFALPPCRVLDTRVTGGAVPANTVRTFAVGGLCQVPADARAVAATVTAVRPGDAGDLRFSPTGQPPPLASTLNFSPQRNRAGNAMLALGVDASVDVRCAMPAGSVAEVHVVVDVSGYWR
jgi:hypothetical protein